MTRYLPLILIFVLPLAEAITLDTQYVQSALTNADAVVTIEAIRNETTQAPGEPIVRITEARVLDVHRGDAPLIRDSIVRIKSVGGEIGTVGEFVYGYPRLYPGKKYRAHLKAIESNQYMIAAMDRGLTLLDNQRNFSRNRTDGSDGKGSGAFLGWDPSYLPIPYYISAPSFAGKGHFISAIEASFQTWRNPQDLIVEFITLGCSSATRNENDGINNVIYVTQDWKFEPAAIAITRNFYVAGDSERAGQILDTDILFNAVNYQFTTTGESGKHDIQNIITHEVGHLLGLGHELSPQDPDATMYPDAAVSELKKRTLAETDLAGIRQIYSGVGTKLPSNLPSCEISDGNSSCVAVHSDRTSPPSTGMVLLIFVGIGGTLFAGRFIRWRFIERNPLRSNRT